MTFAILPLRQGWQGTLNGVQEGMAIKFRCPKCGRKYIDWGAEKLAFQCPECKEELLEIGLEDTEAKAPSLKSSKAKVKAPVTAADDGEAVVSLGDDEVADTDDVVDEDEVVVDEED
jgi:predicted  nucleic acid-binding Zn-ribbon protein